MFRIVSYNIFARSLGSNCIPWVMSVNESWHDKITTLMGLSFDEWIESSLSPEYKKHFHKNYISGNKVEMRKLWSQEVNSAADIPPTLTGLSFYSKDRVQYSVVNANGEMSQEIATTLKGLLKRDIPDIADEMYNHIMEKDSYFQWDKRGAKIFREAIRANEEGQITADLISLTEYDIHTGLAEYRGLGVLETFPEAMKHTGFSGCLMNGPLEEDISGIGIFWKDSVFELAGICGDSEACSTSDSIFALKTGESYLGCAFNYDMMEHWHRVTQRVPQTECSETHIPEESVGAARSIYEMMSTRDRRNVGMVLLRHRQTNRVVMVVSVHLMTESRDCSDTNEFPGKLEPDVFSSLTACSVIGEVRAHELKVIGDLIQRHVSPGIHGIILNGDLNIDVRARDILKGRLKSIFDQSELLVETGFDDSQGYMEPVIRWGSSGGDGIPTSDAVDVKLVEAFSSVHRWGEGVGSEKYCTSFTPHRCSWIDMVWFSPSAFRVSDLSDMTAPTSVIPNEVHGSDHLPLSAIFEFV